MKIKELFSGIEHTILVGDEDYDVNIIENKSSGIFNKDTMFVCISGFKADGHNYANDAVRKGAGAILIEKDVNIDDNNVTVVKVKNTRETLSKIAFKILGNPQKRIKTIGVTGTSGKTSTTIILENILRNINIKSAVLGTLGCRIGKDTIPINITTRTTPDILELSQMFDYINKQNVDHVIMEATSHALDLERVSMLNFEVGIFTNIGIEHLDFHKTLDSYAAAKFKLFGLSNNAVINIDDEYGKKFFGDINKPKLSISIKDEKANLYAYNIKVNQNGTYFDLRYDNIIYKKVHTNLIGDFSVYNILSAIAATLLSEKTELREIIPCLSNIDHISGRFEPIYNNIGVNIIIDYAHTPEQFENIFKVSKGFTSKKLITLFGCGGDRDNSKRPLMGEMAARYSDFVIVAEDNPRSEDPNNINAQVEVGLKKFQTPYKLITDRKKAIEYVLSEVAKQGDTFLMLGKGPEEYQEYKNGEKVHFSEKEVIKGFLDGISSI
ncbi:MAG: UDP-N-acetylmuramoyl-L-alanyl-D-glutamate--2,6-diaminopimelate ligase [Rickettsiales bacterium]|jgi:UDP-N-acetylmuramyl-tripeptide synthetase|nr:UDP-N-acetylmuramoyl-L-alanyl-D-glutamate--2,6-diaminopimelate ligase [Rickettsiales bacterium]